MGDEKRWGESVVLNKLNLVTLESLNNHCIVDYL